MIPKLAELRAMSDDELIHRYDAAAQNTVAGTSFYLDELNRRAAAELTVRMARETSTIRWLTWTITVMTLVNVITVIAAFLVE